MSKRVEDHILTLEYQRPDGDLILFDMAKTMVAGNLRHYDAEAVRPIADQRDAALAVLKTIAEMKLQSHFDDRDFDGNDEELCWLSHVEGIQKLAADFLAAQEGK